MGSHGDVHPFVGLGMTLRDRGHRVSVICNPYFAPLVERAGLQAIRVSTAEQYLRLAGQRDLWNARKGPRIVFGSLGEFIEPIYEAIKANHVAGQTVVAAATLALGARVAQEHLGIPTATVHLQPSVLRSYIDPPRLQGMMVGGRVPRWIMALQWALADNAVIDPLLAPPLNRFRATLGLPRTRRIFRDYLHSPSRVIGLWPDWFAAPQPDWPQQVRLAGFPLYDERGLTAMQGELVKFLADGPPPIAFTFGSAMWHAHDLLEQSARACGLLGRRGILLTRHRDQVPSRLPVGVRHFEFAPFSELLPHCAALVHHGGIGTASQGMSAGVGQLVLPHAHDQHDNAARMQKLGIAATLPQRRYRADHVAQTLADLLGNPRTADRCAAVKARFAGADGLTRASEFIEQLL